VGEVSIRILHLTVDLARKGGADSEALLAGLPSLAPRHGDRPALFDWSDFVVMWERLEKALGGPEGFARVARAAMGGAYPESRALTAVDLNPEALFNFLMLRHMRTSFRNVDTTVLEKQTDGWIRFSETIRAPHRGCEALHRATRTFVAQVPLNFDLPAAEVEVLSMTPQTAEFRVRFPPGPSTNVASGAPDLIAAQLDEAFSLIIEATDEAEAPAPSADSWANKLRLSPRQRDVFARLVQGRANKEIAAQLKCSERNVEFHVGRIFRAASVASRAELLVKVLGQAAPNGSPSLRLR
jgi:DNA-binding CsgD family transcriptional regulator